MKIKFIILILCLFFMTPIIGKSSEICSIGDNYEYKKDMPKLIDNFIIVEKIGEQSVISKIVLKYDKELWNFSIYGRCLNFPIVIKTGNEDRRIKKVYFSDDKGNKIEKINSKSSKENEPYEIYTVTNKNNLNNSNYVTLELEIPAKETESFYDSSLKKYFVEIDIKLVSVNIYSTFFQRLKIKRDMGNQKIVVN